MAGEMTETERNTFLSEPRDAVLSYVVPSGRSLATPIWFRWDGSVASFQSPTTSVKTAAMRRVGRASLCVHEQIIPSNRFVTLEGTVTEVPFDLDRDIGQAARLYMGDDAEAFLQGIRSALDAGREWASFVLHPETIITRSASLL